MGARRERVLGLPRNAVATRHALRRFAHHLARRALRDLAAMDDHILRDIGLSRFDVIKASTVDFGSDRMAMLERARARRKG